MAGRNSKFSKSNAANIIITSAPVTGNILFEKERARKFAVLMFHAIIVQQLRAKNKELYKKLHEERGHVYENFIQLITWRNWYNSFQNSQNPNIFIDAFEEIDQEIVEIANTLQEIRMNEKATPYEHVHVCVDFLKKLHATLLDKLYLVNMAENMDQLKKILVPRPDWLNGFHNPIYHQPDDQLALLEVQQKIKKCFSDMQYLIRHISSNGDM